MRLIHGMVLDRKSHHLTLNEICIRLEQIESFEKQNETIEHYPCGLQIWTKSGNSHYLLFPSVDKRDFQFNILMKTILMEDNHDVKSMGVKMEYTDECA